MSDKPTKTTPWKYYNFFVEPNYYDFVNDEGSITRGFNACVPAFQLADVFYRYYARHDPTKILDWKKPKDLHIHLSAMVACTLFRRHRVRRFDGIGGASWRGGSLRGSLSLRLCA